MPLLNKRPTRRLGRGAPIVKNPGNQRFRELILADKERYITTSRHVVKEEIARKVVNSVLERGGRFLSKLESDSDRKRYNVPEGIHAWVKVSDATSMQKVKQALREHKTGEPRSIKRKQPSPGSAALEKKLKAQTTETPAGAKATDAAFVAVTTEAKRPLTVSAGVASAPEQGASTYDRGPFLEGTAPYSPLTMGAVGRFPGPPMGPMGEDYSHFRIGQPQPGQVPQYRSPFYPGMDPDSTDPYGYPPRYNVYYYSDLDVAAARRQHSMYHGAIDSHARAQQMASMLTSSDRQMHSEGTQQPPSQIQHGAPFVSPAGYRHSYAYDTRYSPHQRQFPLDQGPFQPYPPFPPTHDPAEHEYYMMGRQPPPPPPPRYGYPHPHHQNYRLSFPLGTDGQQETKSVDGGQQRSVFNQQRSPQQHHRLSSPLMSRQEAKFEDAGQQRGGFDQLRTRSASSLSDDSIPAAKTDVEKE